VHTHSSSGMSGMTCLAVAEAGATAVDAALSPFAGGTSQPPTETLVGALRGTPYDPKLDLAALAELAGYFAQVLDRYRPLLNLRSLQTDPGILLHQVPGGMLSNLLSQLHEQEALDRLPEVLAEVPRVRADLGYPPLVTPTSQIVGVQAVVNVLTGERYRTITKEVRDYVLGLYGSPPAPIDPALRSKVVNGGSAIEGRPADRLPPEFDRALSEVRALTPDAGTADALSFAMFPDVYRSYRTALDAGLTSDVLAQAALGVVAALRAPPPPAAAPTAIAGARGLDAWAHEGRAHHQAQRRWVDANRRRTGW